jgi:hypothetical protein
MNSKKINRAVMKRQAKETIPDSAQPEQKAQETTSMNPHEFQDSKNTTQMLASQVSKRG